MGFTAGMTQRKIKKHASSGSDKFHHVPAGTQVYCRYAGLFNGAGDQSDRLMIKRSGGDQKDGIRLQFFESIHDFWGGLLLQCRPFVEPSHTQRYGYGGKFSYGARTFQVL